MRCILEINRLTGKIGFAIDQPEWEGKLRGDIIYYDIGFPDLPLISPKKMRRILNLAMTTWDLEIPIKFKPARWHGRVPDIRILFRGDEDNLFRDRPGVLAYAYFPGTSLEGIIVFNTNYIWDLSGKGISGKKAMELGIVENADPDSILKTYNIIQTLIHELGHTLGLRHDATGNANGKDVMDPYYDPNVIDLSDRDIMRIRQKYGIRIFSRWSWYGRLKKWLARAKRRF